MRVVEIHGIAPGPMARRPERNHILYRYLLKQLVIERPNQVWATDITYIRLAAGFVYLVAILDWYSRYVLSWKLSNSLENRFCIETLDKALQKATPAIFNSDQGIQFKSTDFTEVLNKQGVKISMDAKG